METTQIVALCLIVGLVVGINILLFASFKRGTLFKSLFGDVEMYQRAGQRARNPWADEDNNLEELSKLVEQFKEEDDQPTPDSSK